jgi:predicted transcriptional regulator
MADPETDPSAAVTLAELTAQIVGAYVSHHQVGAGDMSSLITAVGAQLAVLSQDPAEEEAKPEPAVPIKRSVRQDAIVCLICGKRQKLLKRHLAVHHALEPDDYRAMFNLHADYPLVAPGYAAIRSAMATKNGLGRKPKTKAESAKPRRRTPTAKTD